MWAEKNRKKIVKEKKELKKKGSPSADGTAADPEALACLARARVAGDERGSGGGHCGGEGREEEELFFFVFFSFFFVVVGGGVEFFLAQKEERITERRRKPVGRQGANNTDKTGQRIHSPSSAPLGASA